jgi:type II secretory pathway component PulF
VAILHSMLDDLISNYLNKRDVSSFSVKDKIFLFKELAYLLDGGVSVIVAIQTIGDTSPNFAVKQVAAKLYSGLKAGESLSM